MNNKLKRLNILAEIDRVALQRCVKCSISTVAATVYCHCPAAVKTRDLGKKLLEISNPRIISGVALLEKIKFQQLTPDLYREIKKSGIRDIDIYKTLKVSSTTWVRWKRKSGLTGVKNRRESKVE